MKKALVLFCMWVILSATVWAEETEKARIVTFKGNVVKCIAPVAIRMIDGKLRQLPATGFKLEPGFHILAGEATTKHSNCPKAERRSRKPLRGFPAVEWFFEPDKVYYIGVDRSSIHEEEWRLIVWKVKFKDGETVFDISRNDG